MRADVAAIDFVSTGRFAHVSQSDGIELSEDGKTLYFTALGGTVLYEVPTAVLRDQGLTVAERQKEIRVLDQASVPTDGMILVGRKLLMGDLAKETLYEVDTRTGEGRDLVLPEPVHWADSFARGADGSVYFTTSEINYDKVERVPYGLYRLTSDGR